MGWEEKGNPGPQPKASNMRVLEWNADLALIAHRWASQCIFGHDLCRDTPKYPVGQNIARGNFATNHDLSFIANWFDYVQYVNEDDISSFQFPLKSPLRQYTQLIWAETYQIGCARVLFQKTVGIGNTSYHEHFVCNYGPTGNILGQSVYKIGDSCSNCPEGTGCAVNYEGLCGSEINFDIVNNVELHQPKVKNLQKIKGGLQIDLCSKFKPKIILNYLAIVAILLIVFN